METTAPHDTCPTTYVAAEIGVHPGELRGFRGRDLSRQGDYLCVRLPYHKTSNLPSKEMLVPWNSVLEPLLQVRRLEPAFPEPVNLPLSAFPLSQWRHANFVAGRTSISGHTRRR